MHSDILAAARAAGHMPLRARDTLTPLQLDKLRAVERKLTPTVLAKARAAAFRTPTPAMVARANAQARALRNMPPGTVLIGPPGVSLAALQYMADEGERMTHIARQFALVTHRKEV